MIGEIFATNNKEVERRGVSVMGKMNTWGVTAQWLVAVIFVTFFTAGPAFAQTQAMQVEIPYKFTFGSKALPAGKYTFSVNGYEVITQSSGGERFRQNTITEISGPGEFLEVGSLVFITTGGGHILSEVWIPGTDGQLLYSDRKVNTREFLLASYLDQTRAVSGKAAFNQTCGRCHGSDGMGNARADKFFNIAIPRMNSALVQGKSDAELKELINKGSAVMPPVEIDVSGFRHRLPPQDVDAVIAYVRTLKR
jgi:mono/diheme cytochrome c family protein